MSRFHHFTLLQKIICYLAFLIFIGSIIYIMVNWSAIPDRIPSHYNIYGQPDNYSNKSSLIFLIVIFIITYATIQLCCFFPSAWNMPGKINERNAPVAYSLTLDLLVFMTLVINLMFAYLLIKGTTTEPLGVWFTPATLGGIFIPLIIYFIRFARLPK